MIAPESFELDDVDGHSYPRTSDVSPEYQDRVSEAARSCPEQAIAVTAATSGSASQGSDRNGVTG